MCKYNLLIFNLSSRAVVCTALRHLYILSFPLLLAFIGACVKAHMFDLNLYSSAIGGIFVTMSRNRGAVFYKIKKNL